MRVYISGAITNNKDYVTDFINAAKKMKSDGYQVIDPSLLNNIMPEDATHEEYMKICLPLLDLADAIYMIPGWGSSKGACIEYGYAIGKDKIIISSK